MKNKVLIVHGYSDGSTSFDGIRDFLIKKLGYAKQNIRYMEYASMDDEATFRDYADKMDADYEKHFPGERIDVICHSTGALVTRAWLALHLARAQAQGKELPCPVERLIMMAPANFGSDLARMGQSFLGKIRCTFFNNHSHDDDKLESGKLVLQGLEPASPFQWELSERDLHGDSYFNKSMPKKRRCFPFVFAAGEGYGGLQAFLIKNRKKPGTDGTVRICGTSLNTRKCTFRFKQGKHTRPYWHKERKFSLIPFVVCPGFNHGSIVNPNENGFGAQNGPGGLLKAALQVTTNDEYRKFALRLWNLTEQNYATRKIGNRYQQFFFRVRDDVDRKVDDFHVDFFVENSDGDFHAGLSRQFDKSFESTFHKHSADPACRVMMLNIPELKAFIAKLTKAKARLVFQITATTPLPDVKYQPGRYVIMDGAKDNTGNSKSPSFIHPNTTTLIDIVLNRIQSDKLAHFRSA